MKTMDSAYVPFSFSDVYQGFAEGGGIATATASGLTLEFQVKDSLVGMIKSDIHKITIPLSELHSVALKQSWFRSLLSIKVKNMTILARVPGSNIGQVELRVARRDRATAQALVSILMLGLSEKRLADLGRQGLTT
jgi:hypothetical protein